ncbi:MAG: RDD family protein [Caldimonas sp.]
MSNDAPDENRFAPPLAHVEDVASGPGALADRGTRLGAAIVDVIIAMIVFGLLAALTSFNVFRPDPAAGVWLPMVRNTLLGFIFFIVINGYLLATRGQTVGKMFMKIRIVRSDGSPASFARLAGLRYLLNSALTLIPVIGSIYGVIDALFIFRANRRCVHDLIADTVVVKV